MAVIRSGQDAAKYYGLMSDTLPSLGIAPGDEFIYLDAADRLVWTGTAWARVGQYVQVGPSGAQNIWCLLSDNAAPGANDVITSATGFTGFTAFLSGPQAAVGTDPAFAEMVAVSHSTTAADHAGVATLLAIAVDEFDGGPSTPPAAAANTLLLRNDTDVVRVSWDGVTRIKTIGVRQVGDNVGSTTNTVAIITTG